MGLLRNVGSQNKLPNGFSHPMLPTGVGYITRCFLRSRGSITNCHGDPRRLQHTHIVVSITNGQHFRRADSEEFCQPLESPAFSCVCTRNLNIPVSYTHLIARLDASTSARDGAKHKVGFNMMKIHLFDKDTEEVIR